MSERYSRLASLLEEADSVAVALSGGVDSALVAAAATDAGIETVAITIASPVFAEWQRRQAVDAAEEIGIRHVVIETDMVPPAGFDRCYRCKQEMARRWKDAAAEHGCTRVADGVTAGDLADPSMPGARAAGEMDIWHPLAELGLSNTDVREIARRQGLSTWDAPSDACLASRLPSEGPVTRDTLRRIERAEHVLRAFTSTSQVRARVHDDLVRIEVPLDQVKPVLREREAITTELQDLGFRYVTLDLEGFRHGSMHRSLRHPAEERH